VPYVRPELYPKQKAFVDDTSRFTFVEAGTKAGKTIAMVIWLYEQAFLSKGENEIRYWLAPYYSTAKIAFRRMWQFIPQQHKPFFKANESELSITANWNSNKVYFKSAEKPDALYGEDVHDVVVDEASRMREESWHAVRSTLTATQGRAKVIGNVKGKKNWFFRLAQQAKQEGKGYYRLTSADNPFIPAEEIEEARKNLPENIFNELYLSIPNEDGSNPFGDKYIKDCIGFSDKPVICYGIDLAKSFDYTVIIGLDSEGTVAYFERFQKDWSQTKQEIIKTIGKLPTSMDSTGVGDPITEEIQRHNRKVTAFKFTSTSKQQIMEGLANAIQSQEIRFPDNIIKDELLNFEFVYTRTGVKYSAPEGLHDDCVCALALAWSKYKEVKRKGASWVNDL